MTNEDYRPVLAMRMSSHSIEFCDKVGTEISKYASGLAINNSGVIAVKQDPRLWYIPGKKVPEPQSLVCSGPRPESVASEPRNSDYVHINFPPRSIEWSKAVEIFVYTDVQV